MLISFFVVFAVLQILRFIPINISMDCIYLPLYTLYSAYFLIFYSPKYFFREPLQNYKKLSRSAQKKYKIISTSILTLILFSKLFLFQLVDFKINLWFVPLFFKAAIIGFSEELLIKGVLFSKLKEKNISTALVIIITVVFFVGLHQGLNYRFYFLIVFGSITTICYVLYPSLLQQIIFHTLWNFINFSIFYLEGTK